MKIIFKNKQEFLNTLYGDEEDYSYIKDEQIKEIIKDKLMALDRIYEHLGDTEFLGKEQYDLGDCENLIQLFENIEFEEDGEEEEYIQLWIYMELLAHKMANITQEKSLII